MKLVIDIGNTNIVVGVYKDSWNNLWRIETKKKESLLYYSYQINDLLWEAGIDPLTIEYKVLSTVVPGLKVIFKELLENINESPVIVLDRDVFHELDLKVSNPYEIGTDLVANALAANKLYKDNAIIIDFGTALTFTVVNKKGKIIGVNIAPGVNTAINALVGKTSQLPYVDLKFPINPIGTNTVEAIQNGVLVGYVGLVKYMIKVIKSHLELKFKIVVTGGLSFLIAPHIGEIDHIEPNLTLHGLMLAGKSVLDKTKKKK